MHNDIVDSDINYTSCVHKLQVGNDYNKYLLQAKRHITKVSATPPPNLHPLYIPGPKYSTTTKYSAQHYLEK